MRAASHSPLHGPDSQATLAVRMLKFEGGDAALVQAVCSRHPGAPRMLIERHGPLVRRVLARVLGMDQELNDLTQEVFARAFTNMHKLNQPDRLGAWLTTISVFTARAHIRKKRRQRWLSFWAPEELPEPAPAESDEQAMRAMHATYALLEKLPTDERIVFALRFIEELELKDVAAACDISLATTKRRLARASERFEKLARGDTTLRGWLQEEAVDE